MKAFWDLDTERSVGMGVSRIPWGKMIAYAEYYHLDGINTETFVVILRTMDTAYLIWQEDQEKRVKAKL